MATERLSFEGYYDYYSGWEFDLPVVMMRPCIRNMIAGSATAGIERAIEDHMIALSLGEAPPDEWRNITPEALRCEWQRFRRAKMAGRPRRGATYWNRTVEYDTDEPIKYRVLELQNAQ